MINKRLISCCLPFVVVSVALFGVNNVRSSIVTEVKPGLGQASGQGARTRTGETTHAGAAVVPGGAGVNKRGGPSGGGRSQQTDKSWRGLPSSISRYPDLLSREGPAEALSQVDMNNEVASAQFSSRMSKIYSKTPKSTSGSAYPKYTSNELPVEKYIEDFYTSGSMLTMEARMDSECAGHMLEAEGISKSRIVSFKCPSGSAISYLRFDYKELTFAAKKSGDSDNAKHTEVAITGLGFGCDDNNSFIQVGSLARAEFKLSIPQEKKMWIHRATGFLDRSITGEEYLAGFSASGIDGTFGVNVPNNDYHIAFDARENPPFVQRSRLSRSKDWSGSFITGGCVGLNSSKGMVFINKIGLIPITVHPLSSLPLSSSPESYKFEGSSVRTERVLSVPKLWPECQMLFGTSSGRYQSNFFLFKLPNSMNQLYFNLVEVIYTPKHVPISIEFRETVSKGSVFLGKRTSDPKVIRVSRTGSISQITIGIAEDNMSRLQLGLVSYFEVVIDGISTIFVQESIPSFRRTFSGSDLKYICAEVSDTGILLGFGAYFTKKLYVLPFIQGGVQTHFPDLQGIFSAEEEGSASSGAGPEVEKVQYLLPRHKKRSLVPVIDFISDRTIDVYQGKSITSGVCGFGGPSTLNEELDYYLVACKPGYFLKGLHAFSKAREDAIQAFQIACGNGEVRVGDKTPYKKGLMVTDDVQEAQSLAFEIGYSGGNLSGEFMLVSMKIYDPSGRELYRHKTVDRKLKKIINSDSSISWKYSRDGPFNGICFAIETLNGRSVIRGMALARPEVPRERQISESIVRPRILYPAEYRAFGTAYIAFGDVAIASRVGYSVPEECGGEWIAGRDKKKRKKKSGVERSEDVGVFTFTCPRGHVITHIHAQSNRKTKQMGVVGLLCSDGYSGSIIGTYDDLIRLKSISLVESLLSISPPYYIQSVLIGVPQVYGDRFIAKLETFSSSASSRDSNLIFKYLSRKDGMDHKKVVKSSQVQGGPFDTFCALIQSKLIKGSLKLKKEGILNVGVKPAPKKHPLGGGNPVVAVGNIYVNQVSYPQCQMTRSPLTTEVRETFAVSCPGPASFARIIPLKLSPEKNSKIVAFVLECERGGRALVGYSSIRVDLMAPLNIPDSYKGLSRELPAKYLTEVDVSFDFKMRGLQGLDLYINDGRSSIYPVDVDKEEIPTLYTRRYIGYSLSMICLEFGESSRDVTGLGVYFESQGLYWESEFILPPTQFPLFKESAPTGPGSRAERSKFVRASGSFVVGEPEAVCRSWAGAHDAERNLSFGLSCGKASVRRISTYSREQGSEIAGLEAVCDDKDEDPSSFCVGVCDSDSKLLKKSSASLTGASELEFGFSKKSGSFGFFLASSMGVVKSKYRSKSVDSEGLGSSTYWTSESNGGRALSTLCFDIDEAKGDILAVGVPSESNEATWSRIEPMTVEEIASASGTHYASEPRESRVVRGVPKVNSQVDLDGVSTPTLNEFYGGYITHNLSSFLSHCRKLVGVHKDSSRNTAVICPKNHRVATLMLYLSSPPPQGRISGMRVACHSQFESDRVSVDDSWTGMFDIGTKTEHLLKQGSVPTTFKRLSFGLNSANRLVYVYGSDESGRKYIMYSQLGETVSKLTEYSQSDDYNYLRGLCFEMDREGVHRVGFVIE